MAKRIIDLSYTIHEGMTTFPVHWHPAVEITHLGRHGIENRETRKLVLGTHTGTHCDAPRHFVPGGQTIDQLPLDTFIGPARLLDFSAMPDGSVVTRGDLADRLHDARPQRLVLRFGWDRHWGTRKYYKDHPFLADDAAEWLLRRGVKLLAMDTPMPDDPANGSSSANDSPVHKILLGGGMILVEYLTNLSALRRSTFELFVLPLKIRDGDGAPARVVAIEEE
jgi:kynurenine formamidase